MQTHIKEIAERIRGLREMMNLTVEEMADFTEVDISTYNEYESGQKDFGFTFLYKCAEKFGIDIVEILTGENPRLSMCSIVRAGNGLDIKRRKGFKYEHLAYKFKNKISEPFLVTAPYMEEEQDKPIHLSTHKGQEFDFVISGKLKVEVDGHIDILNPGDAIYYDSSKKHGMTAFGGEECKFLAVVMKDEAEDDTSA